MKLVELVDEITEYY